MQGDTNASPWKVFNQDLLEEIRKWRSKGNTAILGMDANGDVKSEFLAEPKMYNLIQAKHGMHSPNTHIKGSHAVDFIFVTEDRIDPTEVIGMLPFEEGINSDHRGFFVNINQKFLLCGEVQHTGAKKSRKLKLINTKRNQKYRAEVSKEFKTKEIP
eukprot:75491-Ditylum_brightwellii.AAC.1